MFPDQGRYQERYRLTGAAARSLGISVAFALPAAFTSHALPLLILSLAIFALITVPCLVAVASRKIAFRADQAGITLGADPLNWPFRHALAVFVPWAEVEGIVLYRGPRSRGWGGGDGPCIGIQRRQGAPALSRGNQPARRCAVPGVAAGAARPITAWRLDRERLATLTAAVAPAVPIIDGGTGLNLEQAGVPAMPAIGPGEQAAAMPQPLADGISPTIGWQNRPRAQGGPAFVIIRRSGLGSLKAVQAFPLTEEGWVSAWQSLVKQDPGAAAQVLATLKTREVDAARLRAVEAGTPGAPDGSDL